jgi:signal transduction histidine kinase
LRTIPILLGSLFASREFYPHGYCYLWNKELVWLNVVSDSLIAVAYFAIPLILVWFIRARRDLPFSWMFALFGVFIIACGMTHLMEVWNLWHAQYWLAGAIKAITAAASLPTAVLLAQLIPQAIDLPSSRQWLETNAALERELFERRELEVDLRISFAKITRDMSERKELEERLKEQSRQLTRSNDDLVEANKELESFSYSVSHDLRAPLRAIDGFSLALLEDCADKLDDQGKSHLNRIRAATQRMGMLIDDLLNLARLSRSEMHLEAVDVSALVSSSVANLEEAHKDRKVEFKTEDGLKTKADKNLLRVALENLLSNAWKFTSKRPLAHVEFGQTTFGGVRAYYVRDDGVGFDPQYADRLFGAFQRLHAVTEFPGTGVGLATVQRIIRRHGGRIWAEGAPNEGATFYFTLAEVND